MRVVIATVIANIDSNSVVSDTKASDAIHVYGKPMDLYTGNVTAYDYLSITSEVTEAGDCIVVGDPAMTLSNQSYLSVGVRQKLMEANVVSSTYVKSNKDIGMRLESIGAFAGSESKGVFFWG